MPHILKSCSKKLMRKEDLTAVECEHAFLEMLAPQTDELHVAAFLILLRNKIETTEELWSFTQALKKDAPRFHLKHKVLDMVGTGGDGAQTINISTGSAILAASCGVKIAKQGGRSVSSLSGSADVLEALGVAIELPPQKISTCIDEVGIGFYYAPLFQPILKKFKFLRQRLGIPTTFNLLGPLSNPASPEHYIMGSYDKNTLMPLAQILQKMGSPHSLVVHSVGLDEMTSISNNYILEIKGTEINSFTLHPEELGFTKGTLADLQGKDAKTNASLLLNILSGKHLKNSSLANTLILNAAAALYVYGLHSTFIDAMAHVKENLYSGKGLKLLNQWIEVSHD